MDLASIGSFEVIGNLGAGPHGSVYRARHLTLGRIVALKHLNATVAADSPEFIRLHQEIERLRATGSEHVVSALSVDLVEDKPVIEMESMGESLEKAMRQRSLDLQTALGVVHQILSGLKTMHAAGIIHGNLKPSNVLQDTTTGSWKVSDGGTTWIEAHTTPTLLASAVLYVAPETLAVPANVRSDLYSAGMIGLEAVLGEAFLEAFPGLSRASSPSRWLAWLESPDEQARALREVRPDIPEPVSQFFARLLAKNPEGRYLSADAALVDLEALLPSDHASSSGALRADAVTAVRPAYRRSESRAGRQLLVKGPAGFERRIDLVDQRTYRVGRDAHNEVALPDESKAISRMHAEIRPADGGFVVTDLDSQNGLWVGGRRTPSVRLEPGVAVKIGGYTLSLLAPEAPAAGKATASAPATTRASATAAPGGRPPRGNLRWAALLSAAAVIVIGLAWFVTWGRPPSPETVAVEPTPEPASTPTPIPEPPTPTPTPQETPVPETTTPAPTPGTRPAGAGSTGRKPTPTVTYKPLVERRPNETEAAWYARDQRLAGMYKQGLSAMQSENYAAALTEWLKLQGEEPRYPNLTANLGAARAGLRQNLMRDGQAAEARGELTAALRAYTRAAEGEPASAEAPQSARRVRDRMTQEGGKAFTDAEQQFFGAGDVTGSERATFLREAERNYRKALEYLPEGDPRRKTAQDKLDRIRKQIG